jgi:hypothetical protein
MNDTLYHYIDPGFSHTQVSNYTLLLLLSPASFSLAVMHKQKLMVWRKQAPLNELAQQGEVQEVLNFNYNDIVTAVASAHFTLIPQSLYNKADAPAIARYLDVQNSDTVFSQPLDADNYVVFKTGNALTTALASFDLEKIVFGAGGWLKAIAINNPLNHHLYLNINDGGFEVVYYRHGKLHLYNTFEFTHEDELAYYTVFVCQQLNLDMKTIAVILSGNITNNNPYQQILSGIFKSVELGRLVVADIPDNLPKHQLLPLTALTLCASLADV